MDAIGNDLKNSANADTSGEHLAAWAKRGCVAQQSAGPLGQLLDTAGTVAYIGFDPTASSLGLGNLVGLVMLVRLARAGLSPLAVVGSATALIGDPSGRSSERALLDTATVASNAQALSAQITAIVKNAGVTDIDVVDNADWATGTSLIEFLRDVGRHFRVNEMLRKDSVRSRLEDREQGISFTEFSYQLLQAFDFWHLFQTRDCRIQLGGSDQWGNITAGIELVGRHGGHVSGLTWPLITRADGTKFGKTADGNLWLDAQMTRPFAMWQHMFATPDDNVMELLSLLTLVGDDELVELAQAVSDAPHKRAAQRRLANEVVGFVHGINEAATCERGAAVLFQPDIALLDEQLLIDVLGDIPHSQLSEGVTVIEALVSCDLVASRNDARRQIASGGIRLNNVVIDADRRLERTDALSGRFALLGRGRRKLHVVELVG